MRQHKLSYLNSSIGMDSEKPDDNKEYQRVLDPEVRLKLITKNSNTVEIDASIPPRRYYKSGLEMVRMANVYLDEGSLENAFILYMKFMTLFIEKIRTHPEFDKVPSTIKNNNYQKLKEVLPKAENLKARLLEQYKREYERFLKDMKRREALANQRKQLLQEEKDKAESRKGSAATLPESKITKPSKYNITPVPPLLDALYPSDAVTNLPEKPEFTRTQPTVNRCTKPSSLLNAYSQTKLRSVIIPGNLMREFLMKAQKNTDRNIETCAILAGNLRKNQLVVTHLLIPEQTGTCDSCTTQREEELFDYQDQNDLITFGWIHTHPTQTAFLSSVDLHTHCSYQRMMPEAIAIVCAPRYSDNSFFCLTPDYGLDFIANCQQQGFHPHPTEPELYTVAKHCEIDPTTLVKVVDLRR